MRILGVSGVEVLAAGPFELGLGMEAGEDFFQGLIDHSPVNVVCANVSGFLPYVRINKDQGRVKVLVTSVIDPGILDKYKIKSSRKLTDPVRALRRVLAETRYDLAIVVIHAEAERVKAITAECPGIDLVIDGMMQGVGNNLPTDKKAASPPVPLVVYNNKRGQYVNYLDVKVKKSQRPVFSEPVALRASVKSVVEDPEIKEMVDSYNRKRKKFFSERKRREFIKRMQENPVGMYLGDWGCLNCHKEIWEGWKKTRHAHAIESLKHKQRENDRECLKCHVTGMDNQNAVGGFVSLKETEWMAGVQCEACHGAGARHAQDPGKNRMKMEKEKLCIRCHNAENDPDFDYGKKWPRISH